MSDSELSDALSAELPPESTIRATLQSEVKKAAKGPLENYTVSKIRKSAEISLGLPVGFFKGDEKWKARSKTIIEEQVARENEATSSQPEPQQPVAPKAEAKKVAKRPTPGEKARPRKKQKLDSDEETSALSSPPSDSENDFEENARSQKAVKDNKQSKPSKAQTKPQQKMKHKTVDTDDELSDKEDKNDGSESDMSVVLDEAPAKKQRSKNKGTDAPDKKSKAVSRSKPKPDAEADPDHDEIKKLQGWLVKCGIRKVWGKELKPFGTPKAKIKHLKQMLTDAGMTGRYSNEKAAQIKEARELAADIEAVQEGNERWGKSDEDANSDGDSKTRSGGGRRLVRGAKNYDFLSSDGEETD